MGKKGKAVKKDDEMTSAIKCGALGLLVDVRQKNDKMDAIEQFDICARDLSRPGRACFCGSAVSFELTC
jgi:hypothetical protein